MIRAALLLPLVLLSSLSLAVTPEDLLSSGQLEARVVVDSDAPYLQRAPLIIAIEIATPRWFSRGTRIRDFRIPDAVVQPVSSFADNQTRTKDGESWSLQRWRFRVYALDAGKLVLPDIRVLVGVNTAEEGNVEGELVLSHPPIEIVTPQDAGSDTQWIASKKLSISESWEGLADRYLPGDAITRIRRFSVADVPAMMVVDTPTPDIPGLSLYAAPAEVNDQRDRGRLTGVREEKLVVTMEQPGDYQLPGRTYRWYNTETNTFESITLEPFEFTVTSASSAQSPTAVDSDQTSFTTRDFLPFFALASAALLTTLVLLRFFRAPLHALWASTERSANRFLQKHIDHWRFRIAVYQRDASKVLALIHKRVVEETQETSLTTAYRHSNRHSATLRRLLEESYSRDDRVTPKENATPTNRRDILALWNGLERKTRRAPQTSLRLNPDATQASLRAR